MGRGNRGGARRRVIYWAPGPRTLVRPARKMARTPGGNREKKKKAGRQQGRREGRLRQGKGRERERETGTRACRRPGLERTASGWNQNTPSLSPALRHPRAAAVRFASPRRRSPERRAGCSAGLRVRGCCLRPPALFQLPFDGRWRCATSGQRNLGFGRQHRSRTRPSGRTRK